MIINKNGFTLSTLKEYLATWQNKLREVFGNDFVIKKEGVVDNVATASSLSAMDIENQIAYLIKQMNPLTAEGEWQDKLYYLIGLVRNQATYTIVSRTCEGTPNTVIPAGSLMIENASTKDQFKNNDPINIGEDGKGLGSFTAEESGAIDLPEDATINIVTPLANLSGVYYEEGNVINIGKDYETDQEFRERWLLTSSTAGANTEDGLRKALLELVNTKSDLKIFENRTNQTVDGLEPHTQRIVINSAYDDETIAQTIFDKLVDGNMAGLQGSISITVSDSEGQTETIKFDRAAVQDIYLKVRVSIRSGVSLATAQTNIKENIMKYISNHSFDMGSKIFANMFASSVYEVDGVTGISELKISGNGSSWVDVIQLTETQVPNFDSTRIQVYED
nr:MAG TPA: Baseplate wedge protein [Caudoviricetes sp.]